MFAAAFGQNSRSTITGIVTDPAGAIMPNVAVEAKNTETGVQYRAQTTVTGNYVLVNLPPGGYQLTVSLPTYKPYVSEDVRALTAQTLRFDIQLEAPDVEGREEDEFEAEEEEGPVLISQRFESGEWSHNVKSQTLRDLPILGFPAGEGGIRNTSDVVRMATGSLTRPDLEYLRINGAPSNTEAIRIDGRDANNGFMLSRTVQNQVGVEAVEEFSIQTSSYPAEFGQAGGGIINIATKSGSNAYHGSAYEYWANEIMNAAQPYTRLKPRDRRNDYGITFGGPLSFPGVYNGHNKTYFFLNFEQLRQDNIHQQYFTVPTLAYRKGDFRKALTGVTLGKDPLGRTIREGAIYDPNTERLVYGKRVRDPFPSNIIRSTRFDSVALKIQALIPLPTDTDNSHVVDNYMVPWRSSRRDTLGSLKLDHSFARSRLSFYFGMNDLSSSQEPSQGGDGFTTAVTSSKPVDASAQTYQLSYERTLSPSKTLHLGIGYQGMRWRQKSAYGSFDQAAELGLTGATFASFPFITGLNAAMGGMKDMGANMQSLSKMVKPSANFGLTWIRKSHVFKFGGEVRIEGYPTTVEYPAYGSLTFSADQTGLPSTLGQNLQGGTIGFPYASFLLGLVNNGDLGVVSHPRLGKHSWAFFAQDNWKVTRKLTLEYGLRYDYQTYLKDGYGRIANFSPSALNPSAGNLPGAMVLEGGSSGHCNCDFAKVYPFAFGPRLGFAFQLKPRIIIRGGFGVIYGQTATDNGTTLNSGSSNPFYSTTYDGAAIKLSNGLPPGPYSWPDTNQIFVGSGVSPMAIDGNAGRPPRQMQWNLSVQTEITPNLYLEVAYVGNRGVWWESNGLANINALTETRLETFGLDITDAADRTLLTSALNSSLASQRGFSTAPYAGFPMSLTVAQSLRPFPQFGDIHLRWAPLGRTWYDSLQARLTKRYSFGLELNAGFSWQKAMAAGNENTGASTSLEAINNAYEPTWNKHISGLSQPYSGFIAPNYTFPKFRGKKLLDHIISEWRVTAYVQYASGLPIPTPISNSNLYSLLFQKTLANRVAGTGLTAKDLSGNDLDPMQDFALNPRAWTDPDPGKFSTSSAYYSDYRFRRRPSEQVSVGRTFRIKDNVQLSIRGDFQNVLNRPQMADPTYINAGATQVKDSDGVPQSGFGFINYKTTGGNQRNGMIVVKLQF